jgi:hypothetical protein
VSIFENLQTLSLDTKALIGVVLICWLVSEVRHRVRHRADALVIQRLRSTAAGGDRALLEVQRPPGRMHGAALAAGKAIARGREAGQYFSTAIQNRGLLDAEEIEVSATLGSHNARVVSAPRRLQVSARVTPIELRLPFGFLTSDDVQRSLRAGMPLRLRVAYRDANKNAHLLEECFTFVHSPAEQDDPRSHWLSRRGVCPS